MGRQFKSGAGGRRPGAGRPRSFDGPAQNVTVRLPVELVAAIDAVAGREGRSRNDELRGVLSEAYLAQDQA